jgi:hypothetical protein
MTRFPSGHPDDEEIDGGLDAPSPKHTSVATKSVSLVSTWRGKKLDEYSKAELIEIVCELGRSLEQEHYEHSRQLDVVSDLLKKGCN